MFHNRITDFTTPNDGDCPLVLVPGPGAMVHPAITPDLYAMAWTLAQRDYELDKLFNAPLDWEI